MNTIVKIKVYPIQGSITPTPFRVYFFNNVGLMIGSKNVETLAEAGVVISAFYADLSIADIQVKYVHPNTLASED